MDEVLPAAFGDELEKLGGLPSYLKRQAWLGKLQAMDEGTNVKLWDRMLNGSSVGLDGAVGQYSVANRTPAQEAVLRKLLRHRAGKRSAYERSRSKRDGVDRSELVENLIAEGRRYRE